MTLHSRISIHLMNLHGLYYLPMAHRLFLKKRYDWVKCRQRTANMVKLAVSYANDFAVREYRHRNTRAMLGMV